MFYNILHHTYESICFRIKSELIIRRFEKCLCFTLASLNYYENLLHKFSILLVYFPLATAGKWIFLLIEYQIQSLCLDHTNAVSLGFEDSTINADEVSFENQEAEENETNRYIELLK